MASKQTNKRPEPAPRAAARQTETEQQEQQEERREPVGLVKSPVGSAPANLMDDMRQDAGKGLSTAPEDNLIPLVYILQAQSPQVNDRGQKYINGAEKGDIWLRSAAEEIVKGEDGILVQPCHFSTCVVEWVKREDGGGFVARHNSMPADAKVITDPKNPNRRKYESKTTGHQYVETREHAVIVHHGDLRLPYVIPMSSSGHTTSRGWMTNMNGHTIDGGYVAPSWALLYRLRTDFRSNALGEWFGWKVEPVGWVEDPDDYRAGRALHDAFASGTKKGDAPVQAGDAEDDADLQQQDGNSPV